MLDTPERRDPEKAFVDPDAKDTACAITISTQMSTNRSMVVQTYLGRDDDIAAYNVVVDKLTRVVDRQEAKLQVESWSVELETRQRNLNHMLEDYQRIEVKAQQAWESRGKKGAFRLSEQELGAKNQAHANISRAREEIERLKNEIAKARGTSISEE